MKEVGGQETTFGDIASPILFFTLADGKNLQSERVLIALHAILQTGCPNSAIPKCIAFASEQGIVNYFEEKKIPTLYAVAIFDDAHIGSKCFSPLRRGDKGKASLIPSWSPARWGVVVNPKLLLSRIISVAFQMRSDFVIKFPGRIAKEKLPWGNPPSAPRTGRHRLEQWKERKRERSPGYFVLVC